MTRPRAAPASTPLGDVVAEYHVYVAGRLDTLTGQVADLNTAVAQGDLALARSRWLAAQCTWQQVGAAYGSFGDAGTAINGLANGLPLGEHDPGFTGLHRIEYGLYHDEALPDVGAHVTQLQSDVADLRANLDNTAITPTDMPIRCHEILEDALRDHLSGQDDYGSGMAYALTSADVLATRVVLAELEPLLPPAPPGYGLNDQVTAALDALDAALNATQVSGAWPNYGALSKHQRQPVNGAIGATLEVLYLVPFTLGNLT